MRTTTWSLFQKLAFIMRGHLEQVPVAVATTPQTYARFASRGRGHFAGRPLMAQRRQARLMPRSSLGRAGRVPTSQPI